MRVDVTKELEDEVLEIEVFGEVFKIYDIPLSVFLKLESDEATGSFEALIERLSFMLKMTPEDVVSKIGLKTARIINLKAMDWIRKKTEEETSVPLSGSEQ